MQRDWTRLAGPALSLAQVTDGNTRRRIPEEVVEDEVVEEEVPTVVTPTVTTPTTTTTTTTEAETPPQMGAVKRAENGTIVEFDGTKWVPVAGGRTREVITQDPNAVPMTEVAGADANMPVDRYMETLGVNSLAGQAYQEALTRRLASIEEQQLAAGQTYQDMYEQARMSQAARRGMSDVSGMTGGMADQYSAQMSAAEMASLGQIGMGRESAIRGLEQQRLAAPMEAFAEGQAIDQFETARQELERTRMMQDTEMQRAQTLFEQAQSGWFQDPTTGNWQNIDQLEARERASIQDRLSLQAVNAEQRAETIGEMQYWQAVLADPTQAMMHESARVALGELQTRYANLLLNNQVMTGMPGSTTPETTPTPQTETETETENTITTEEGNIVPRVTPADGGVKVETGLNLQGSKNSYVSNKLIGLGITPDTDLPNFRNSIRDAEDLAPYVVTLAGDKATEGYDFAQELELVNRYLTNTTQVSKNEFNKLQEAGIIKDNADYYEASHGVDIKTGGMFADFLTDNPANAQFIEELITKGYMPRESAVVDKGNYTLNIAALRRKANDQTLTWESLYDQFLSGSLRPIGSTQMSATQSAGYSSFDPRMMG